LPHVDPQLGLSRSQAAQQAYLRLHLVSVTHQYQVAQPEKVAITCPEALADIGKKTQEQVPDVLNILTL
jgi:hypothetical protein